VTVATIVAVFCGVICGITWQGLVPLDPLAVQIPNGFFLLFVHRKKGRCWEWRRGTVSAFSPGFFFGPLLPFPEITVPAMP